MAVVEHRRGDLLAQRDVEVIVNAWNRNFIPWWLLLPQVVSGAIKRRAGYAPFRELRRAGILRAGDAVETGPGELPFRAIIHVAALSAWWSSSEAIIRRCVVSALDLAQQRAFASLAVPLLGAGTGGVKEDRARQAIDEEAQRHPYSGRVVVVTFAPEPQEDRAWTKT